MDELEEMDIDEPFEANNLPQPINNAKKTKRKRPNVTKDDTKNNATESDIPAPQNRKGRKFLKARQKFNLTLRNILILDTNVFMHDLTSLKDIIERRPVFKIDRIVVPYVVIEELDFLKNKKNTNHSSAQNAIRYINEMINSGNNGNTTDGCLFIDKSDDSGPSGDIVENKTNDDKILNICGKYLYDSRNSGKQIVLLSGDINLRNKAFVHKILSKTVQQFKQAYTPIGKHKIFYGNQSSSCDNPQDDPDDALAPEAKRPRIIPPKGAKNPVSIRKNIAKKPEETGDSSAMLIDQSDSCDLESVSSRLHRFVNKTLVDTFPGSWRIVFPTFGPSSTFHDCLLLIKNNWLGLFSDHFKRNPKTLTLIKSLLLESRNQNVNIKPDRLKQLSTILDKVK